MATAQAQHELENDPILKKVAYYNKEDAVLNRSGYVHRNVVVKKSKLGGYGLFASGPIQVGEIVAWEYADKYQEPYDERPGKKVMTEEQMRRRWPDEKDFDLMMSFAYQVGENLYLGPLDEKDIGITTYQNHSCDPNTWWFDDYTLTARREIHEGEEITFDYGTCESIPNPEMPVCLCGTALCRGNVRVDDYLNKELQERYGNHWVSYLLERQRKHREEEANLLKKSEVQNETKVPEPLTDLVENDNPEGQFIDFFQHKS